MSAPAEALATFVEDEYTPAFDILVGCGFDTDYAVDLLNVAIETEQDLIGYARMFENAISILNARSECA